MAVFNTFDIQPQIFYSGTLVTVYITEASEPPSMLASGFVVNTLPSDTTRSEYGDGYIDGELIGFSDQHEEAMEPIQLGETDDDKKAISFTVYSSAGYPASGLVSGSPVASPIAGDIQTNRDLAGYVNSTGTFVHLGDGEYRYVFSNTEVASGGGEGNIWLRVKIQGYRTVVRRIPIRDVVTSAKARDAVLNAARSGFVGTGTVGEGIAIASSLLQGNFLMDQVTNTSNGQTAARIRCFHTGAATAAATAGGSLQGEFATFIVTTTYSGPNKVVTHRVVQQ